MKLICRKQSIIVILELWIEEKQIKTDSITIEDCEIDGNVTKRKIKRGGEDMKTIIVEEVVIK